MLKQIFIDQTEGKTIKKALKEYERLYLVFTDDTFLCVKAVYEYGDTTIEEEENNEYEYNTCIALGIITQEEIDKIRETRLKEYQEKSKKVRLIQYQQLKKEFE